MTNSTSDDNPRSGDVTAPGAAVPDPKKSWLDTALNLFATVRAGEGFTVLLLALNLFLLLCAYYIVKPVRDQLIIDVPGGAELKAYASGASAVALLLVTPLYGALVDRMKRNRLIIVVTCFFVACLVAFGIALGLKIAPVVLAVTFYLWVSVFSMMVVAQLWAFANDVYTEEQGKRLFAIVGIGASLGAVFGGLIVALLESVSLLVLLLLAAAILLCTAGITQWVHRRESGRARRALGATHKSEAPQTGDNALRLVLRHRYLVLLAAFTLLFTLVNSNGEYMVSKLVKDHYQGAEIREFYAEFYSWVNLLGLVIQSLVVSRIVAKIGVERAFFIFPVLVLFTSATLGVWPVLGVIALTKKAENATDYSLNNTLRNMLWLPTTREMKYKAKQVVDTLMVRLGDVGTALLVAGLSAASMISVRGVAWLNFGLTFLWLYLAVQITRDLAAIRTPGAHIAQSKS